MSWRQRQPDPKIVYLRRRILSDLSILNQLQVEEITEVDLSENFIQSISSLSKFRFRSLTFLNLALNSIVCIQVFAQVHMPNLFGNQISDATPLVRCQLKELRQLRMGFNYRGNQLDEIEFLGDANWPHIEELTFDLNNIISLAPLKLNAFSELSRLYLSNNQICSVQAQYFTHMPNLKVLSLKHNYINSIRFLEKANIPLIQYIDLTKNHITTINSLFKCRFDRINKLSINDNKIVSINDIFKTDWKELDKISFCTKELMQSILSSYIEIAFGGKFTKDSLPINEAESTNDETIH